MSKNTELKKQAKHMRDVLFEHRGYTWQLRGGENGPITTIKPNGRTVTRERYAASWQRTKMFKRDKQSCRYCGEELEVSDAVFDHVRPYKHGGKTTTKNMVTSCQFCNKAKLNQTDVKAPLVGQATNPFSKPEARLQR